VSFIDVTFLFNHFLTCLDQLFFTKWCYSPDINYFWYGSALNPDSSSMNCHYSPWLIFSIWTLLCGGYRPFGLVFITNFIIVFNSFIGFTCVVVISLALPVVSNLFPVSYERNVKEQISSENSCTWWDFYYCVVCWSNSPCCIVMNVSMSAGGTESAMSNSEVRIIVPRTWWTHSQPAFACGFLIVFGLRFMPYESCNVSKCSLNSDPLSHVRYWHLGIWTTRFC
jgi:hypothetical protein